MTALPIDHAKADAVIEQISLGSCLTDALKAASLTWDLWYAWLHDTGIASGFARARARRAEHLFEEMLTISNTPCEGVKTTVKETEHGKRIETVQADMIEHRRLQVDTRKWILARMDPQKYGDRLEVEHGGTIQTLTAGDVLKRLQSSPRLAALAGQTVIDVPQAVTE